MRAMLQLAVKSLSTAPRFSSCRHPTQRLVLSQIWWTATINWAFTSVSSYLSEDGRITRTRQLKRKKVKTSLPWSGDKDPQYSVSILYFILLLWRTILTFDTISRITSTWAELCGLQPLIWANGDHGPSRHLQPLDRDICYIYSRQHTNFCETWNWPQHACIRLC